MRLLPSRQVLQALNCTYLAAGDCDERSDAVSFALGPGGPDRDGGTPTRPAAKNDHELLTNVGLCRDPGYIVGWVATLRAAQFHDCLI